MKVKCPYCESGKATLKCDTTEDLLEDGEGIPCKCSKCKKEFVVFITIASNPNSN